MLAPSKGPNRVGIIIILLPEDGNRSRVRNVISSGHLEFWKMDKVHKPSDSEC
jgi:hypothetical protein